MSETAMAMGEVAPRISEVAPDFQLSSWDGRTVRLSDYRGQRSVVLFFSAGMS
jgi:peroxiredoxin